nr:hypothetical protein [uncultured Pseudomonas sp.]
MSFDWHTIWEKTYELLSSQDLPAWIQAIGSVAAIVYAVRISRSSINHAASAKRKTIFAIAEAAHTHACNIRKAIDVMAWNSGNNIQIYSVYDKTIIEGVVKALQGVPMHELGSSKAVIAMLSLTDQMVFLGSAVETLIQGPYKHPVLGKTLESLDDHERRQEIAATSFSVLQQNTRGHLTKIDQDYEALKESLRG